MIAKDDPELIERTQLLKKTGIPNFGQVCTRLDSDCIKGQKYRAHNIVLYP